MELKVYINLLLKKWWIVIPTFLATLTAGIIFTYTQTPIYESSASYVVVPSSSLGDVKSFTNGLDMLGRREEIATTFAEIASSRRVKQLAIESLGLKSAQQYSVGSKLVAGTNIIEFTVQGPDPDVTRDVANAIGATTEDYVQGSYEVFNLRLLDEATVPRRPKSPDTSLNLMLTTILGFVLGIGLAFLSSYLETPLNSVANFNIIDTRTGAYNKDYFLQRLSSEMVRAKRNRYPLSVALLRLDNLGLMKGLNSAKTRGEVLHQVSNLAGQYLREEDILAHLEDDTFGILLPDLAGENAKAMMEYLQTRVSLVPFQSASDGVKFNLKGAVGIATYDYNGTSREEFVAMADRALQLAKVSHNGSAYLINHDSVEN